MPKEWSWKNCKKILPRYLANLFIFAGIGYIGLGFWPIFQAEIGYFLLTHFPNLIQAPVPNVSLNSTDLTGFNAATWTDLDTVPVNTKFSILIPKIRVNAPIVENIPVNQKEVYFNALRNGVAHAQNTPLPSLEAGNTYLFAHSTPNIFDIQKYSAVFTLLNKLEPGDEIIVFYQDQRFNYSVVTNEVVESFNLNPLTRTVQTPVLTLQTCDPPGIPINRRIVTAELTSTAEVTVHDY